MPIKTTNLSYEEFYNKLFSLLRLVEGIRTKIYADSADDPKITIGIGFNIDEDNWLKGLEQRFMLIVQMIQKLPLV